MPVHIFIAEHQAVYRAGVRALLEQSSDFIVVGEADNGAGVINARRLWETDVLVLDTALPGVPTARELVRTFRKSPKTHILIVAMNEDRPGIQDLLSLGARGCVLKESPHSELVQAVQLIAAGQFFIDPELAYNGIGPPAAQKQTMDEVLNQLACLSPPERNVCRLLAHGFTHAEVAEKLGLCESDVEAHHQSMMKKLGFRSRADLLHFAIDQGLLLTH